MRCDAVVAVNYVCEAEPGLFRNTTEIFDRTGTSRGRYFKQHLPRAEKNVNLLDEEYTKTFRVPEIVEIDGIRFGFLWCLTDHEGADTTSIEFWYITMAIVLLCADGKEERGLGERERAAVCQQPVDVGLGRAYAMCTYEGGNEGDGVCHSSMLYLANSSLRRC